MNPNDLILSQFIALIITEIVFLWVNYKFRFCYGTMEQSHLWRFTDRKMGLISIFLHPLALIGHIRNGIYIVNPPTFSRI